MSLLGIVGGAA